MTLLEGGIANLFPLLGDTVIFHRTYSTNKFFFVTSLFQIVNGTNVLLPGTTLNVPIPEQFKTAAPSRQYTVFILTVNNIFLRPAQQRARFYSGTSTLPPTCAYTSNTCHSSNKLTNTLDTMFLFPLLRFLIATCRANTCLAASIANKKIRGPQKILDHTFIAFFSTCILNGPPPTLTKITAQHRRAIFRIYAEITGPESVISLFSAWVPSHAALGL